MHVAALLSAGYLIGALPIAYVVVRLLTGRDLRLLGTGNVGVMNTIHNAGLPAGMIVFIAEGSKGAAAVVLGRALTHRNDGAVICAVAALVGVNWSIFLGFAGGRGSTLSAFVTVLISPWTLLASALLWLSVYGARRDNFLATRANIVCYPLIALLITRSWQLASLAAVACLILLVRHDRRTDDHYQLAQRPTVTPD
jgi:acyl phosphate:glycerol-3-phosphate acyltransferase